MSDFWIISVSDKAYGPYTTEQMNTFAGEGRLASTSLVARAGETQFRTAGEEPAFSALFQPSIPSPALTAAPRQDEVQSTPKFGRVDTDTKGQRAHFVIAADMKSRSIQGLEEEIFKMGPAHSILPQAWILSTDLSINMVRNKLVQQLGKLDVLFVVDATHDKAAWFNFGMEADARIRKIWAKDTPAVQQAYG